MAIKHRPFFSLVVPCYNDGRYAPGVYLDRLLSCLLKQGIDKKDLEVILSDDHSLVPYEATVKKYTSKLNIKQVVTDYNYGPGNTRQKGVEEATGQWLCFADHDDIFPENALFDVKKAIEDFEEPYILYTDFDKVDPLQDMKILEQFRGSDLKTWVHGKFYNLDNFWKPFKIHFMKDLKTHEDIALGKYVECALTMLKRHPAYLPKVCYYWTYNEDSVSHSTYYPEGTTSQQFVESHFEDYLNSTISSILDSYEDGIADRTTALNLILPNLASAWLVLAGFGSSNISHYLQVNDAYCSKIWNRICKTLSINLPFLKVLMVKVYSNIATQLDELAKQRMLPQSFIQWLTYLETLDYDKIIDDARKVGTEVSKFEEHRPYFSLVIACYNDGRYEEGKYLYRLLDSVVEQDIPKEDLEVILSDDCSPVPFIEDIQKKYGDRLLIKYIKTDYNCCPGNTREKGVTIVTGQWLCFADHDDIFYKGAFKQVQESISNKEEKHFIFGDFYGVDPQGNVVRKYECSLNWCHGKFYNKDNFWDKYGIHFVHDLKSHEDIAICTQVSCVLSSSVPNYTYIHKPLYAWTDNPQSVSHAKYTVDTETGPREFLEVFYKDYITSTGRTYIEWFNDHKIKITYALKGVLEIMCYAYFYQQGFAFRRPDDYYKENLKVAGEFIYDCKKIFNINNTSIYNAVSANRAKMYYDVMEQAKLASGRFIPQQTFRQWLDIVSPDY